MGDNKWGVGMTNGVLGDICGAEIAKLTTKTLNMNRIKQVLIIILLSLAHNSAVASMPDNLKISSDSLAIKQDELSATFSGSVLVIFDNLRLTTSKLIVFYTDISQKRDIRKIVIPSKLKAIKDCGKEIVIADRGEFDNITKKLTLNGNVKMQKDGNVLVTDKLIYSANFESINQGGDAK